MDKSKKIYEKIQKEKYKLELNYKLMELSSSNISGNAKLLIKHHLDNPVPDLNIPKLKEYLRQDAMTDTIEDMNYWLLTTFRLLNHFSKQQ